MSIGKGDNLVSESMSHRDSVDVNCFTGELLNEMSHSMRKPGYAICEQQRRRSVKSDQCLYCLLTIYM